MRSKKDLGKVLYNNSMFKVIFMDFGVFFGELYGVFRNDTKVLSSSTVSSGARKLADAIRFADYLEQLNKYGGSRNESSND